VLSSAFDARYKHVGATKRGSYSAILFLKMTKSEDCQQLTLSEGIKHILLLSGSEEDSVMNKKTVWTLKQCKHTNSKFIKRK